MLRSTLERDGVAGGRASNEPCEIVGGSVGALERRVESVDFGYESHVLVGDLLLVESPAIPLAQGLIDSAVARRNIFLGVRTRGVQRPVLWRGKWEEGPAAAAARTCWRRPFGSSGSRPRRGGRVAGSWPPSRRDAAFLRVCAGSGA